MTDEATTTQALTSQTQLQLQLQMVFAGSDVRTAEFQLLDSYMIFLTKAQIIVVNSNKTIITAVLNKKCAVFLNELEAEV